MVLYYVNMCVYEERIKGWKHMYSKVTNVILFVKKKKYNFVLK